jgi:hypothetical protein
MTKKQKYINHCRQQVELFFSAQLANGNGRPMIYYLRRPGVLQHVPQLDYTKGINGKVFVQYKGAPYAVLLAYRQGTEVVVTWAQAHEPLDRFNKYAGQWKAIQRAEARDKHSYFNPPQDIKENLAEFFLRCQTFFKEANSWVMPVVPAKQEEEVST